MLDFLRTLIRPKQKAPTLRRRAFARPRLETLEDRCAPAVLTVNSVADNTSADSTLTLREAIMTVDGTLGRSLTAAEQAQVIGTLGANNTIQFNLSAGPQTITLTGGTLSITKAVTITGSGAASLTINGNNQNRDFIVGVDYSQNLSLVVAINGVTIAGGLATASGKNYGAGILNFGTLTLNNCIFTNNLAGSSGGGGIYNDGALTVNSSTFTANSVNSGGPGGAIQNATPATLTINNCTFTGNTATNGASGACLANSGNATVIGSTFANNTASSDGGGIYNSETGTLTVNLSAFTNNTSGSDGGGIDQDGVLTCSYSTFSSNSAGSDGGGIDNKATCLGLTNCTLVGNSAETRGGGIMITGPATLTNCTIIANRVINGSGTKGGGITNEQYDSSLPGVPAKVYNSIIAGNFAGAAPSATPSDIMGALNLNSSSSFNLIGTGGSGGLTNGVNGNQVGVINPGLGALANNGGPTPTVALLPGNPAIDHGSNAYVTAGETDQRGLPRIVNGTVDIGAFEVQGPAANLFTVTGFPSSIQAGTASTITVTAELASGAGATGYTGTVHFTSSDLQALLPANYTFVSADNGVHTFSVTLKTAGSQTVTATDTVSASITGAQSGIVVTPAAVSSFAVAGFANPTTAGAMGSFRVTARDAFGNTAAGYTGTVHFTSSDPQAVLPADYTFIAADNGVHAFSAILKTAGSQTITATDSTAGITGAHAAISVTPASASTFTLAGFPTPTQAGVSGAFTVTAFDAFGNAATGYLGTVHFTSSDAQAVLPADYTFVAGDKGTHIFSATFKTAGSQIITATDTTTASITGTHAAITVNPAPSGPVLLVNSTADNTTADNVLTLREAIEVVDGTLGRALTAGEQAQITGTLGPNDAIQFNLPPGPQTITLTGGALDITKPVALNGPGAANLTINGNNHDRVLIVGVNWSPNVSLVASISGLTIAGGNQTYGGGLLNFGTLTVANTTFANNTAGTSGGGGLYNVGALTLNSCTFTGNTVSASSAGAGIENNSAGAATINNCLFTNNSAAGSGSSASSGAAIGNSGAMTIAGSTFTGNTAASDGGAIYSDGSLTVTTSTFLNNAALSDGGAIRSGGTLTTIAACTFAGNSAASAGGALDSTDTTLNVTNSTFADNTAVSHGAAVMADSGSGAATLTNCTITANTVTGGSSSVLGAGLYAGRPVTLHNTIVAGNFRGAAGTTADDIAGTVNAASSFNLIGSGGAGGLVNGSSNNQVGVANLGLGALANNGGLTMTVALLAGSPAIDQGSNTFVVAGETDQRGMSRIVNGAVDIGAFEVQS